MFRRYNRGFACYKSSRMGRPKLTLQEFQQRLDARWKDRFEALSCEGGEVAADVRCLGCGTEFSRIAQDVIKRGTCPGCSPKPGEHWKEKAAIKTIKAARKAGVRPEPPTPSGQTQRSLRHHFICPKHGKFSVVRLGAEALCPRCHRNLPPNHPDSIPQHKRGKACVLYLLEIRDREGYFTKVGISTNWEARKMNYRREGVEILKEIRMFRTTLYHAAVLEMRIKRQAKKQLGRRRKPRKAWAGWSESHSDPFRQLPGMFDRAILLDKHSRS